MTAYLTLTAVVDKDGDGGTGQPPLPNTPMLCDLPNSDEAPFALSGQSVTIESG